MYTSIQSRQDNSSNSNLFAGKVICGECGGLFGRKVWNSTNKKLRRVIWQCNHKYEEKGKVLCKNRHVDEELLKDAVVKTFEHIRDNPETYIRKWEKDLESESPLLRYHAKQIKLFYDSQLNSNYISCIELLEFISIQLDYMEINLIGGIKTVIHI